MSIELNPNLSENTLLTARSRSSIFITAKNILLTTLLCLFVIAIQRLDYFWLENSLGERSMTELFQALFLLFSLLCFYQLKRNNCLPGATLLASGFFSVLLIRELDAYFDMILHGFWVYPALNVTFWSVVYALREKDLHAQMSRLLNDKNMQMLITFVVLLFVFSRLYGMGNFWQGVMGEHYVRDVKDISEETIELLCYTFIAFYSYKAKLSLIQK